MKPVTPLLLAFLASASLTPAAFAAATPAGQDMAIAAVVGDEAISSYDVANRIKFIVATARMSNTPDVIERIRPQVLRSLIDEKLQLQEAAKNDIKVTQEDIDQAVSAIEEQRSMPPGMIYTILDANAVPKDTFTQQIKAQLSWNKLLMKKIRPTIHISDEEIKLAGQRGLEVAPKQTVMPKEVKIAVITLPVDKPARDTEIRRLGEKLVGEVRSGASFEEVSRQFSSVTASAGGKVEAFWVKPSQLDPHIAKALGSAKPGTITDPIRSNEGYTIIKVYDVHSAEPEKGKEAAEPDLKDSEVYLKEILLKVKPDAADKEADVMLQIGEEVAKHPGSCEEKGIASVGNMDDFDIEVNFERKLMSELPPAIKAIINSLKIGDISTPFASYEGIRLFMLCEKKETDAKPIDRERVYGMLVQQKMELESQKYIRNLRRESFVDIR